MTVATYSGVRLAGVVTALPDQRIELREGHGAFGRDDVAKVLQMTGVEQFYLAKPGQTSVDFCTAAAVRLLEKLEWEPESVDALIYVTQTPDYRMPGSAYVAHGRLGLSKGCLALDLPLGCSGYVYGYWMASQLVHSKTCKRVLLLNGDTLSRHISPRDRSTLFLFGDGGAATALEADETAGSCSFVLGADGQGVEKLYIPAGGAKEPQTPTTGEFQVIDEHNARTREHLHMDGLDVFNFSCRVLPNLLKDVLAAQQWNEEQVDAFFIHQASRFIMDFLVRRLKLPKDKVLQNMQKYGNTSSVTIPLLLTDFLSASDGEQDGQWVFAGFGVGYSWASAALQVRGRVVSDCLFV